MEHKQKFSKCVKEINRITHIINGKKSYRNSFTTSGISKLHSYQLVDINVLFFSYTTNTKQKSGILINGKIQSEENEPRYTSTQPPSQNILYNSLTKISNFFSRIFY